MVHVRLQLENPYTQMYRRCPTRPTFAMHCNEDVEALSHIPSSLFLLGESALTKVRRHMILIVPLPAQCIHLLESSN